MLRRTALIVNRSQLIRKQPTFCNSRSFLLHQSPKNYVQDKNFQLVKVTQRNIFTRGTEVPEHLQGRVFRGWHKVFGFIAASNILVWLMWQTDFIEEQVPEKYSEAAKQLKPFLNKHFLVSRESIEDGRLWTMVTSQFTHHNALHLAFNLVAMYTFGSYVFHLMTIPTFTLLFVGSAVTSSLTFAYGAKSKTETTHGLSGTIVGIAAMGAAIVPLQEIVVVSLGFNGHT